MSKVLPFLSFKVPSPFFCSWRHCRKYNISKLCWLRSSIANSYIKKKKKDFISFSIGSYSDSSQVHISSSFPYLSLWQWKQPEKYISWRRAIQYKPSGDQNSRAYLCPSRCAVLQVMKPQSLVLGFSSLDST